MSSSNHSLMRRLMTFTALLVALGAVSAAFCGLLAGSAGVQASLAALLLCLVPGWVVFLLEPLYRSPGQATGGAILGSILRLGLVMGGALAWLAWRPDAPRGVFLAALGVHYLAALTYETIVLMRSLNLRAPLAAIRWL